MSVGAARLDLLQVTPLVLTFNEAPNIGRCLERLSWAGRVVVLDSGSTDDTVAIARRFANVGVFTRPFDDHTSQWNHGLTLVETPWVLSLDADYLVPESFPDAAAGVLSQPGLDAAFTPIRYCIFGHPLRGSLYPPRAVLFRRERCRYEPDGHTQRLVIPGPSVSLTVAIDHDDRKSISHWFASQDRYARLEAEKLVSTPPDQLTFEDRVRKSIVFGPAAICVYTLFARGAILDGWPGWYYTLQRTLAETLLSLQLLDRRLRR